MTKYPILIDTDPGVDDTFAIMLAKAAENLNIVGLTVTAGNVGITYTLENTLGLCELIGLEAPVYKGAEKPMIIKLKDASDIHGNNGLGGYEYSNITKKVENEYAWDALYNLATQYEGELSVVALGPLTNIAIALLKYPDLPKYIKKLVIMGGASEWGNTEPYSEFNFWCDPHAAEIVLKSDINMQMIGLNATRQTFLTEKEVLSINSKDSKVEELLTHIRKFYLERLKQKGLSYLFHIPDAVAMAAFINPSIIEFEKYYVTCITDKGRTQGWSIVDTRNKFNKEPNIEVAMKVDKEEFLKMMQWINAKIGGVQ